MTLTLYRVTGPDNLPVEILGLSPLLALKGIHAEAFGPRMVRVRDGELVFRDPTHQQLVAGIWRVERITNGDGHVVVVNIAAPEPLEAS